ncbi:hypothetical protein LJC72_13305 [Bacteroides sp. OttesenSCG-928-D19]|nr:hypothetical protein [Bacteroides sp. OttesenSCG-928-N06]MDL2306287.1 hypothetical protein [Bacteroides sp. OttesenSCG-928-D19]
MKRAFAILLLLVGILACEDTYQSSIPDVKVSFSCNMVQSEFTPIQVPGQFVKVTRDNHNIPVGYGGLIIGQSIFPDNGFCAYDAACPVEASRTVSLEIINNGLGGATCPSCGTKYNLSNFGFSEVENSEPLKQYKVTNSGTILRVSH